MFPQASFLAVFLLVIFISPMQAQNNRQYQIGNRLFQQQEYEEAYKIFSTLHEENPENYTFLDKATECLINLKRYEEAIQLTRQASQTQFYSEQARIKMGEIYHVQGDTSQAFSVWEEVLERNSDSYQTYLSVARTMSDRRAFNKAVGVYEQARSQFNGSTLLSTELANTYMQAGQYENAVNEFLTLVHENPDRIDYVQRSLIRYGDEYLHDIAILEIEEFMDELSLDHPAYPQMYQLHLWLLLERDLYQRAVATAKAYEERTSHVTYSLLGLGNRLLSEQEFELAEETYRYYIDNNIEPAKYQSMEDLSQVYSEWADFLAEHNLAHAQRRDSLYQQAFDILTRIQKQAPYYNHMGRVLIRQAELAIDYLHDVDKAKTYLNRLRNRDSDSNLGQQHYVEGRINLYESDYDRARIAFTKSNNQEQIGELAEKTRYYLALTDFYSGDYEFAKIQLNALERQNTSYYANDAVQLRVWIQKGLNADTTGTVLEPFAKGIELFNKGKVQAAIEALSPVIASESFHPLMDDALLELSLNITPEYTEITYNAITNYLEQWGASSALQERLMWEKARIADQVVSNNLNIGMDLTEGELKSIQNQFYGDAAVPAQVSFPTTQQQVQSLYEDILLTFPSGFYASYARERIQELNNPQT